MIKAVLIDDEKPSLRELQYFLREYEQIEVCGSYTDPEEAMEAVVKLQPSIVFIDINMPGISGLEFAKVLNERNLDPAIVFITAYEQYALEAFSVEALDYIMKPISKKRFEKTIKRILARNNILPDAIQAVKQERKLLIRTFGKFEVVWENGTPFKWHSKKTKELFAFLVHNEGREVSKEEIMEAVFPDADTDKGIINVHNGIYYIRKALRNNGVEENRMSIEGSYKLRLKDVDVDSKIFRQVMSLSSKNHDLDKLKEAEEIFRGDYLKAEDWIWVEEEGMQLSVLYRDLVLKLVGSYIKNEDFSKAEELLLKLFAREPYDEEVTKSIILLYLQTKRKNQAILQYRKYEKILKEELGAEVDKEIKRLLI